MNWIIRNIIITSILAVGVFVFVFYSETGSLPELTNQWIGIGLAILMANVFGVSLVQFNRIFNRKFSWRKSLNFRFLVEVSTGIGIWIILSAIYYFGFIYFVYQSVEGNKFWEIYLDGGIKYIIISIVLIYLYSMINFSIFSYNQYSKGQIEKLAAERNQVKLRFEALKTQLNPHFLFNALNTISSLLYKDIRQAENFIRQMAGTYRYILSVDKDLLVPVSQELEMIKSYYFMQKVKYEDCSELTINLSESTIKSFIPPLTLQMLIENALKHNKICENEPLKIEISDDNDKFIVIRNNIVTKPELLQIGNNLVVRPDGNKTHKIGLANIKKRYSLFADKEIDIIADKFFTVKLPVILTKGEKDTLL